jgi:hypothetical protein
VTARSLLTVMAIGCAAFSSEIGAQEWRIEAQGGRIRSALDPSAEATPTVAGGISYQDRTTAFRVSTGVPIGPESPYWGAAGVYKRAALRKNGFLFGIDLNGNGYLFRDRTHSSSEPGGLFDPFTPGDTKRSGHALAGQAMPVVGIEAGPFQLHARAGVSYYTAAVADQSRDRTVKLGDVDVTFQPNSYLALTPVIRRFHSDNGEDPSTFAGMSAAIAFGRSTLWVNGGQWLDVDTTSSARTSWGAGASLNITDRARINASARHDGYDPLYLNPSQTSWSVGLSMLIGGRIRKPVAPVPSAYAGGIATIRLRVSESASPPSIAGDFNNWAVAHMEREGDYWTYRAPLAKGVYNFSFVSADGTWFVPRDYPGRKDDGMGGHVAVLVVR